MTQDFLLIEANFLMNERARSQEDEPLLTQLTLLARENGTFQLHLRDNGEKLDPLTLGPEALADVSAKADEFDIRALGIHAVKMHARQFLYWNYQGFNTMTLTI